MHLEYMSGSCRIQCHGEARSQPAGTKSHLHTEIVYLSKTLCEPVGMLLSYTKEMPTFSLPADTLTTLQSVILWHTHSTE